MSIPCTPVNLTGRGCPKQPIPIGVFRGDDELPVTVIPRGTFR